MIKLPVVLAFIFASILSPATSWAENDRSNGRPASYSCFQSADHCLKDFARTHDREVYDLCLLSDRVCRTYQFDWKVMRSRLDKSPGVLNDCFPVVSVKDLLKLCQGGKSWEKDACHQNIVILTSRSNLRGKLWRSWTRNHLPMFCNKSESTSDEEFIEAFVEWAKKHPSQQALNADAAIVEATAAAWRCSDATVKRRRSH